MWSRLGVPKEVLTDRGTQFISNVIREVDRLLAKILATSSYHAQYSGLVKRFDRTLKSMLECLCQDHRSKWDRYLPAFLFAYREVPQESLGFSPSERLFRRLVRGSLAVIRQVWTDEEAQEAVKTTAVYVTDLKNNLEEMCVWEREICPNLLLATLRSLTGRL